jgi:glutaredoxin
MGRILLYTTRGCALSAEARSIVRSWGCTFYEICLSEQPDEVRFLEELHDGAAGSACVPQLLLNERVLVVYIYIFFFFFFFFFFFVLSGT